jgi:putative zinc finger/helix-turn-helix YgiT family protein
MKRECMTEQLSCPHCEQVRDVDLIQRDETVSIKGREVAFKAHLYRCATCGEEFETSAQLDINLNAAREAHDRIYEAPTAEQLVALRAKYGASQKAFGMILGFGELTMNSYEHGASPDSTNRMLLKLAERPLVFKVMYEINSMRIGALQRQRIEVSEGFKSARAWTGMEALAVMLTPLQRRKIEECADCYGKSILQTISTYVAEKSFRDYSQLINEATWSKAEETVVPSSPELQQDAS